MHEQGIPKPGDIVVNPDLGVGRVIRLEGTGRNTRIKIAFGGFIAAVPVTLGTFEKLQRST
jgi:hypothetical protein